LRRKSGRGGSQDQSDAPARGDAVIATLGYPRRSARRGPSKQFVMYGAVAVAIGFAAIAVPVYFLAPAARAPQVSRVNAPEPPGGGAPRGAPDVPPPGPKPRVPASAKPLETPAAPPAPVSAARPPAPAPAPPARTNPPAAIASAAPPVVQAAKPPSQAPV